MTEAAEVLPWRSTKDRAKWCKGKAGRPHQPVLGFSHHRMWRSHLTRNGEMSAWLCPYVMKCSVCGKVLLFPSELHDKGLCPEMNRVFIADFNDIQVIVQGCNQKSLTSISMDFTLDPEGVALAEIYQPRVGQIVQIYEDQCVFDAKVVKVLDERDMIVEIHWKTRRNMPWQQNLE